MTKQYDTKVFLQTFAFESLYPVLLAQGFPLSQNLIIFFGVILDSNSEEIEAKIDKTELQSYAWVSIETLINLWQGKDKYDMKKAAN